MNGIGRGLGRAIWNEARRRKQARDRVQAGCKVLEMSFCWMKWQHVTHVLHFSRHQEQNAMSWMQLRRPYANPKRGQGSNSYNVVQIPQTMEHNHENTKSRWNVRLEFAVAMKTAKQASIQYDRSTATQPKILHKPNCISWDQQSPSTVLNTVNPKRCTLPP